MTAVAQRSFGTVFATAKVNGAVFFRFVRGGCHPAPFVRAIAKRLGGAQSAAAPVVRLACFDFNGVRGLLGNVRCAHGFKLEGLDSHKKAGNASPTHGFRTLRFRRTLAINTSRRRASDHPSSSQRIVNLK